MLEIKIKRKLSGFDLDVELDVDREILAIIGPSGSGKTMTLLCIAGLIRPHHGHVKLNGKVLFDSQRDIDVPANRRRVGFVFQNYALFPHLTVRQNIGYGLGAKFGEEGKRRIEQLLETMNIQGLGDRYPRQISSGQQQRVAIARALAPDPEVLLFDEPFSALDTVRKDRLELELLDLQKVFRGDILFVTHDTGQGYRLGSRIAVYEAGKIVQCDRRENVISCPINRNVAKLTGTKNLMDGKIVEATADGLRVSVAELGGIVRAVTKDTASFQIGSSVVIGIRPEYIMIDDHPRPENSFLFSVNRIVSDVATFNCHCRKPEIPGTHYIDVSLSRSQFPVPLAGGQYYLHFPPEHLALITDPQDCTPDYCVKG